MNTLKDFVNWKLSHADKVAEAEEYPLIMENCKKYKKMKQLEVYGNSVQDGTPTPENPIEVQSVGEKSVNLTDGILEVGDIANATGQNSNSTGYFRSVNYTLIMPNTVYTITASKPIQFVYFYDKDYNFINLSVENARTFTTPENCGYIRYRIIRNESIENETVDKVMLVLGSTDTTYEPYGKYKIPVVQRGINLFKPTIVSATASLSAYTTPSISNSYGTTIDSTDLTDNKVVVTQANYENATIDSYRNGFFGIRLPDELIYGNKYIVSFNLDIISNPLDAKSIVLISGDGSYYSSYLVDTPNGKKFVCSFIHSSKGSAYEPFLEIRNCGMSLIASNFMITEDGYEADYEPYVEPTTTNIFLSEPLRKIGGYADYIDYKENKVHRLIHEYLLDGSQTITYYSDSILFAQTNVRCKYTYNIGYSNYFPNNAYGEINNIAYLGMANNNGNRVQISLYKTISGVTDAASMQQWFREHPTTYIQVLTTPTEEPISTVLPKLNAKTTIIEVDTSLAPSDAYGKYIKK